MSLLQELMNQAANGSLLQPQLISRFSATEIRESIQQLVATEQIDLAYALGDAGMSLYPNSEDMLAINGLLAIMRQDWQQAVDLLEELTQLLIAEMPASEQLYPDEVTTEETLEMRICELVREAALEGVRDELPHSLAVTLDEMGPREGKNLFDIHVNVWVERDSQKAIVIGHRGSRLSDVGKRARLEIEKLVGQPVFLSIRVKVAPDWQRDPKQLGRLGF